MLTLHSENPHVARLNSSFCSLSREKMTQIYLKNKTPNMLLITFEKKLSMRFTFLLAILIIICSCENSTEETKKKVPEIKINYPAELVQIFDNHGGLDKWQSMKAMSYEIVKEGGNEKQSIDLRNRREKIEASNFTSGFDGKEYWVEADTSYKGNPKFYTNLIFYFYAMPFVLADEGINYSKTEAIEFEGKSYPGLRISSFSKTLNIELAELFCHWYVR